MTPNGLLLLLGLLMGACVLVAFITNRARRYSGRMQTKNPSYLTERTTDDIAGRTEEIAKLKRKNRRMYLLVAFAALVVIIVISENNWRRNSYSVSVPVEGVEWHLNDDDIDESPSRKSTTKKIKMVTCPICMGTRRNQSEDFMASTLPCWACQGEGVLDSKSASKVLQNAAEWEQSWGNGDSKHSYSNDEITCHTCNGSGRCTACAGRGEYRTSDGYYLDCPVCHGTGCCQVCKGRGRF